MNNSCSISIFISSLSKKCLVSVLSPNVQLILKENFSLLLPTIKTFRCYEFCLLHMLEFCSLEFLTICYLMTRGDLSFNMLETVFAQHIHTYVIVFRNCFLEMDIFCIPSHHYVHICIHSMIIIFTITILQQMQKIRFE